MSEGKAINELFVLIAKLEDKIKAQQAQIESIKIKPAEKKPNACEALTSLGLHGRSIREISKSIAAQGSKIEALSTSLKSVSKAAKLEELAEIKRAKAAAEAEDSIRKKIDAIDLRHKEESKRIKPKDAPKELTKTDIVSAITETVTEQFVTKLYKKVNK